jgi:tetratricopeptide (TPR) repeat protein
LDALRQLSSEALQKYSQFMITVDAKFEGVVGFGKTLDAVEDWTKVDIAKLTYQSKQYWRAVLEMTPKDSSVLFAHAYLHAANGQAAWSDKYFLIGSLTDGKNNLAEFDKYKGLRKELNKKMSEEIDKGVKLHDQGKFEEAINVYDQIIAEYPNCALAYYEKGLSYMMMGKGGSDGKQKAMQMYAECRQRDPFFWKAYQGDDKDVIQKLQVYLKQVHPFVSGKQRNKEGFIMFAEGCATMELYCLAAHARWKLAMVDSDNLVEHMKKLLDLIEKCGCEDADFFRKQFNLTGDKTSN